MKVTKTIEILNHLGDNFHKLLYLYTYKHRYSLFTVAEYMKKLSRNRQFLFLQLITIFKSPNKNVFEILIVFLLDSAKSFDFRMLAPQNLSVRS